MKILWQEIPRYPIRPWERLYMVYYRNETTTRMRLMADPWEGTLTVMWINFGWSFKTFCCAVVCWRAFCLFLDVALRVALMD